MLCMTHTKENWVRVTVAVEHAELGDEVVGDIVQMVITTRIAGKGHVDSGSQDLNVGIFLGDRIIECLEAVGLVRAEATAQVVLIANLDITDSPGLGVAVLGSQSTILGVNRASQELELIEGILDVNVKLSFGDNISVQSETSPNGEDWDVCQSSQVKYILS